MIFECKFVKMLLLIVHLINSTSLNFLTTQNINKLALTKLSNEILIKLKPVPQLVETFQQYISLLNTFTSHYSMVVLLESIILVH